MSGFYRFRGWAESEGREGKDFKDKNKLLEVMNMFAILIAVIVV